MSTPVLDIFIVTYAKDYPYMKYCLKSIAKFARQFNRLHILVPTGDANELRFLKEFNEVKDYAMPISVHEGEEWPGKGFLWHEYNIMFADNWCFGADFIAHIDPDCVFNAPVIPDDYVINGKPILRFERFENIGRRHPGAAAWQSPTGACLPFPVPWETMRCHPGVHIKEVYPEARKLIEQKTRQPIEDYIKSVRPVYPEGFCEFVTLGNVAMTCFPDRYHLVEQFTDKVQPDNKLHQTWSRAKVDEPVDLWINGQQRRCSALDIFTEVGLV